MIGQLEREKCLLSLNYLKCCLLMFMEELKVVLECVFFL